MEPTQPSPPIVSHPDPNVYEPPAVVFGYVFIKGIGLWFLISLAQAVGLIFSAISDGISLRLNDVSIHFIWQLLPALGYVLAGVMLMAYALPIARRVFTLPGHVTPMFPADTMVGLISVGIGIYLIASSAGHVLRGCFDLFIQIRHNGGRMSGFDIQGWWITAMIQFVVGLFLFLRPNWVVGKWRARSRMP